MYEKYLLQLEEAGKIRNLKERSINCYKNYVSYFLNYTEEVAGADDLHPGQTGGDDRFIGGIYTWGIHLGSSIAYSKVFYHWDTRSGRQKNLPFTL